MRIGLCSISILVLFLLSIILHHSGHAEECQKRSLTVESFSECTIGQFPEGWTAKSWKGEDEKGKEIYTVRKQECYFLEADSQGQAVTIAKEFRYDPKEYPILSWKWRVLKLPKGADERYKEVGDSAAGIYVIFEGRIRRNVLKYVWSSSLPVRTRTKSPYANRIWKTWIIVLENQDSPLDTWVKEEVNVYEDYKCIYRKEPNRVKAIGILSDSDNTNSHAVAHYADIMLKKAK